jgi:hypothetical protein
MVVAYFGPSCHLGKSVLSFHAISLVFLFSLLGFRGLLFTLVLFLGILFWCSDMVLGVWGIGYLLYCIWLEALFDFEFACWPPSITFLYLPWCNFLRLVLHLGFS